MGLKTYTFIISAFLVAIGILVLSGAVSYREMGICFGFCNKERERVFSWSLDGWLISQTECGDGEVSKTLLTTIAPELAKRLRETNEEFELLAQKEKAGTLTVGEREDYLSHSWRVPTPRTSLNPMYADLLPQLYQKEPDGRLVRRCEKTRFNLDHSTPNSYCEGYVYFDFDRHPRSLRSWDVIKHEFYATLVANGEIEWFLDTTRGASRKDYELRQAAKEEVLALPASGVPSADIKQLSQRAYIRKKCDPA